MTHHPTDPTDRNEVTTTTTDSTTDMIGAAINGADHEASDIDVTTTAAMTLIEYAATVADLRHQVNRLRIMLAAARRTYADLVAAARAALIAARDGEPDPLSYLRGEVPPPPPGHPLAPPDRDRSTGGGR